MASGSNGQSPPPGGCPGTTSPCSAEQLLELDIPPYKWVVSDLVPEGLIVLAGRPKMGKSFLVLDIAYAVSTGGKALGVFQVSPGQVLYLALEDGLRRLQQR